jgi:hypothetical protein
METNQINNQIYVAVLRLIKLTAALDKKVNKPTITALTLIMTRDAKNVESAKTVSYIVTCISDPMLKFTYTVKGDQVFIEGLKPGTKYTFAVQAIHENGNISTAVSAKVATAKFNLIKSLKKPVAAATEGGGLDVSFTLTLNDAARFGIPSGTTISYEVYWMPTKTSEVILTTDVNVAVSPATFSLTNTEFAGGKTKGTLFVRAVVTDIVSGAVVAKSVGAKMSIKL